MVNGGVQPVKFSINSTGWKPIPHRSGVVHLGGAHEREKAKAMKWDANDFNVDPAFALGAIMVMWALAAMYALLVMEVLPKTANLSKKGFDK